MFCRFSSIKTQNFEFGRKMKIVKILKNIFKKLDFGLWIWILCITSSKKVYYLYPKNIDILLLSKFSKIQNFDFFGVQIDMAYFINLNTSLFFDAQRAKSPLQALPCLQLAVTLKILLWPMEVKRWPWSKSLLKHFFITFDELSNAVCPSSLALLAMKITGESACFWQFFCFWGAILRTHNLNQKFMKYIFMTLIPKPKKI